MAPLIMPAAPRFQDFSFQLVPNTIDHFSVLDGSADTVAFPGARWRLRATLPPMREDEGGEAWSAFIAELEGRAGRFLAGDPRRIAPRGSATTIGAHQNDITNNTMQGAVVGTIGSGGALPTGWFLANNTGGFAVDVVAINTEDAIEYIDLRFYNPTSANRINIEFVAAGVIAAVQNDSRALAMHVVQEAGSKSDLTFFLAHAEYDSVPAFLSTNFLDITTAIGAGGLAANRSAFLNTIDEATAASVIPLLQLRAGVATTPDITLRIGLPTDEPETAITPPIRTSGTARSRPAGPFVEGAAQAGRALKLGGWTPSASGLLLVGDYGAYDVPSGNRTLHKLTADMPATDITGEAIAAIRPPIREAPADAAAVVLEPAQAVMHLTSDEQGEALVDRAGFYRIAIEAEEIFEA